MYSQEYYRNMFKVKFEELERYATNPSNYSLIQASNPIRSLLLDSQPLVDILNQPKKLPITYRVNDRHWQEESQDLVPVLLWREINPMFPDQTTDIKKDAFLKYTCVSYLEHNISVRDILKFYAYVRGGIHLDNGEKEYDHLRNAFDTIKVQGLSINWNYKALHRGR
jgi:hypothetical protein